VMRTVSMNNATAVRSCFLSGMAGHQQFFGRQTSQKGIRVVHLGFTVPNE
jgi:hypothetical protein